ncbi:MAG: YvcK family protein [Ezakiella sp.]|nr:YvcK family protein [Ezakiella sp.]MDD7472263.1 YvcK family protein [Bacillota bacterium]MDY3923001.1 gluconeogenesis factor YvcK family protein [Ezakiella sp.]
MLKVAAIGGGTGLSILLYGLKKYFHVSAIVTVGDNGGGSGILREDLNMLPPGDIRNCLLALSEAPEDLQKLLNYRFKEGILNNQSLGNLIIAGMVKNEGSFEKGIELVSNVLKISGSVYPVTIDNMDLCAKLSDGLTVLGESEIALFALKRKAKIEELSLISEVKITQNAKKAIEEADFITLGPGSLYTSVICNLLVSGMKEILQDKKIIYISNVMTQPEETYRFSLSDHIFEIEKYLDRPIDYCIANTLVPNANTIKKYNLEGSDVVLPSEEEIKFFGDRLKTGNFLEEKKGYIRSDAKNVAKKLLELFHD